MIVYIAGKMTGLPDHGRAKFNEAEKQLRKLGYKVLNPARMPDDLPQRVYMPICLAMLQQSDVIALLDNYKDSQGAMLELSFMQYQRKPVCELSLLLNGLQGTKG